MAEKYVGSAKIPPEKWYVVTYTEMSHVYKTPVKARSVKAAKAKVIGERKTARKISVKLFK